MTIEEYILQRGRTPEGKRSVLFFSLFVISNRIETVYNAGMEELTLKQLMLLILVSISEGGTFTRYGEIMGSSRQNIKTLARALERKSFVSIRQDESDRRACGIFLTAKTAEHFSRSDAYYDSQIRHLFSELTAEEIDLLFSCMPKFFTGLQRMGGGHA